LLNLFIRCVCILVVALAVSGWFIFHNSSQNFVRNNEYCAEFAHNYCGNKDVAFERATFLEAEGQYPEAADWYMKARERYANMLAENPNDSIRASRMAEMTMRGKGGIINTDTAEYYAHMAKRYDLEAYLAVVNGDVWKSRDLINNYSGERTAYLQLADAISGLRYTKKDFKFEDIKSHWNTIDSLASTQNSANQEALVAAYQICENGITDKDGEFIVAPSLYDALAYAQDADEHYNSLSAQIYLASKFESLHLKEDAEKYNNRANANNRIGNGEITFSNERINELTNDPQALVARAHHNYSAGYTDYRMTAYYYHIADSINTKRGIYKLGNDFYLDWVNFVVQAEDLSSVNQILPLVNKEYPDSIREAIANYVMAMKYSNGYGVTFDTEKSDEYILKAANGGLADAQVACGILWDLDSIADGMKILAKFVFLESTQIHPYAARYILSKDYKQGKTIPELLKRSRDEFALLIKLNSLDAQDFGRFDTETLVDLKHQINIALSYKTDFFDSAFLLGKLAEIEYVLGHTHEADFYLSIACEISPKLCYSSLWGISELARKNGALGTSALFAGMFAKQFFRKFGVVLCEPERSNVVQHFYTLYPELLDSVKKNTGYDFTKGLLLSDEVNFDRVKDISNYESPVKNLRIELPDYVKPTFPITMKYFD